MDPVYINVNKCCEKSNELSVFVKGVTFPKKLRTETKKKNGVEYQALVRDKSNQNVHVRVEHEQDENGELLYMSPCGGVVRESELEEVADRLMAAIKYLEKKR